MSTGEARWHGRWIEPVPEPESSRRPQRLRRVVHIGADVVEARVRLAARGDFAVFINDVRLDAEGPTAEPGAGGGTGALGGPVVHHYDATPHLHPGANVIGVILGSTWGTAAPQPGEAQSAVPNPAPPGRGDQLEPLAVLLELTVVDSRGAVVVVGSDEHFRAVAGAIIYSTPGVGERQEHALRDAGWKLPGFDDATWRPARASADQSTHNLTELVGEPVGLRGLVPAVAIVEVDGRGFKQVDAGATTTDSTPTDATTTNSTTVDFGRRMVGRVRVRFTAPLGTHVTVEYWPRLPTDTNAATNAATATTAESAASDATAPAFSTDEFVSAGGIDEVFEPGFSVHEFRYVRVVGLPGATAQDFTALELTIVPGD